LVATARRLGQASHSLPKASRCAEVELLRSVVYWAAALRRLADSGVAAWRELDRQFPDNDDADPKPAEGSDEDIPASYVSELNVVSAFITGDMALEDLAFADLLRRDSAPTWNAGQRGSTDVALFTKAIDRGHDSDAMLAPARYLDVTLCFARDVLVAHRNPTWQFLPSLSNWGEVKLCRVAVDPALRTAALDRLRQVNDRLGLWRSGRDYHQSLDLLLALPALLDRPARDLIREAYRLAGFESPSLTSMVTAGAQLLARHATAFEEHQAPVG
jgi:hypothetical protein